MTITVLEGSRHHTLGTMRHPFIVSPDSADRLDTAIFLQLPVAVGLGRAYTVSRVFLKLHSVLFPISFNNTNSTNMFKLSESSDATTRIPNSRAGNLQSWSTGIWQRKSLTRGLQTASAELQKTWGSAESLESDWNELEICATFASVTVVVHTIGWS
jgi:hypothetical protein